MAAPGTQISKRRKFVADGVFYAELNEFFQRELAEEGYSGVEVRVTPTVTDIIIRATHTQEVLGEQGRRIRELTSLIQKRFKFPENSVSLYAAKVQNRGLSAVAQCESLRYKLLNGLAVRRACYGVLRFIMESGAKGCEVVGVLGIKVKIMRGSDPEGKSGPQKSLPDAVTIIEPKEEQSVVQPMSQDYGAKAAAAQAQAEAARAEEQQEGGEEAAPAEQQ
ncbi:Heat shock 70 kDa protein 12B [Verticillium dahliae VDG2]|nr:Heat shock 70 kDa protein 12B [Verticillium dahliae VDG2]